jgi:methylamine---glutamate N-methyltransferase subunit A
MFQPESLFLFKKIMCLAVDRRRIECEFTPRANPFSKGRFAMCGIVGLFLKDETLTPRLGELLAGMLSTMCERGPDSAGFAVYGSEEPGTLKLTLRSAQAGEIVDLIARVAGALDISLPHAVHDTHVVVSVPQTHVDYFLLEVAKAPAVRMVGSGRRMQIFKEVGRPDQVADRFGLSCMAGSHAIGHTRMATESAVTTDGAHPFTTGLDQCLVHNGSLSNHNTVRRDLIRQGLTFQTENDSEVAAGFVTAKMHEGLSLQQAMTASLEALDGFYTFVVGTESGFSVLRDPIACKPAVMAETDRWVAFGTEYRALVNLPGVDDARVWEPMPAKVYVWERH